MSKVVKKVTGAVKKVVGHVAKVVAPVAKVAAPILGAASLIPGVGTVLGGIGSAIGSIGGSTAGAIGSALGSAGSFLGGTGAAAGAGNAISSALNSIGIPVAAGGTLDKILNGVSTVGGSIIDGGGAILNSIVGGLGGGQPQYDAQGNLVSMGSSSALNNAAQIAAILNLADASREQASKVAEGTEKGITAIRDAQTQARNDLDAGYNDAIAQRNYLLGQVNPNGNSAIQALEGILGLGGQAPDLSPFFNSPGYKLQVAEGEKAINRAAAGRGNFLSGQQLKELSGYNSGLAAQEMQQYISNISGVAANQTNNFNNAYNQTINASQNTALNKAAVNTDLANAIASLYQTQGQAYGQGRVNQASTLLSGLNNVLDTNVQNAAVQQVLSQGQQPVQQIQPAQANPAQTLQAISSLAQPALNTFKSGRVQPKKIKGRALPARAPIRATPLAPIAGVRVY